MENGTKRLFWQETGFEKLFLRKLDSLDNKCFFWLYIGGGDIFVMKKNVDKITKVVAASKKNKWPALLNKHTRKQRYISWHHNHTSSIAWVKPSDMPTTRITLISCHFSIYSTTSLESSRLVVLFTIFPSPHCNFSGFYELHVVRLRNIYARTVKQIQYVWPDHVVG